MEKSTNENLEIAQEVSESKPKKKLNATSYALLSAHGFNYVVSIFVSTFLISYIYKISDNYVLNIGLFYCFNYLTMGIFSYIVSSIIDKTNRVVCYRVAIIVRALFILSVVFLGERLASLVILAGMLHGFSEAWYWCSFNVMKNELIPNSCMKRYTTLQIIENKGVNFIVPIILGTIIDADSFKTSAIVIFIMASIQIVLSFFIKSRKPENSKFDMKTFFKEMKASEKNKELFKICFISTLLFGATTLVSPVNTIIVMLTFKSNFSLGLLTGVFSAVSIIMLVIAKKLAKTRRATPIYVICAVASVASTLVVTLSTSKPTLIIFNFVYIACSTFYSYYYDLYRNVILKQLDMYDDIAEYQGTIEILLEMSRVVGFALMILTGIIGAYFGADGLVLALKVYFVFIIILYALVSLALCKFEKKLIDYDVLK
ncbi:MAG: MFS transporter [Clostridia bacterium]|nr:MFS transporter [Clostridia bacterium]